MINRRSAPALHRARLHHELPPCPQRPGGKSRPVPLKADKDQVRGRLSQGQALAQSHPGGQSHGRWLPCWWRITAGSGLAGHFVGPAPLTPPAVPRSPLQHGWRSPSAAPARPADTPSCRGHAPAHATCPEAPAGRSLTARQRQRPRACSEMPLRRSPPGCSGIPRKSQSGQFDGGTLCSLWLRPPGRASGSSQWFRPIERTTVEDRTRSDHGQSRPALPALWQCRSRKDLSADAERRCTQSTQRSRWPQPNQSEGRTGASPCRF
jgi:hypothetical protein